MMERSGIDEEFINTVKMAIRRSVRAVETKFPNETLSGYALCTDDGLETLLYYAITREALHSSSDADLLFCPTDWPYTLDSESFDEGDKELRNRAESAKDIREHIDSSFGLLVDALSEMRKEGVFGDDVFLSVLSTDPSEYLEMLENMSVEKLNQTSIVSERDKFLEKWR